MRAEKLAIEHKMILFDRMKKLRLPYSEYSFANLYLFRRAHDFDVVFDDNGEIWVRGKTCDGYSYFMPTRDLRQMALDYLHFISQQVDFLYPIPEEWIQKFPADHFSQANKEEDSDYIFTVRNMASYPGGKLHKKRNLLKQFIAGYEHQGQPLVARRLPDAIGILEQWQKDSGETRDKTDYYPCLEAIKRNEELVLCGLIYYADKEPAGFILGEELAEDMFVVKFAKAKTKFKGIYQYIFNDFARLLPQKYQYFNMEVDLGKAALRQSKSSYAPAKMLKKYRVSLKRK